MNLIADHVTMRYFRKSGQTNYLDAVRGASLTVEEGKLTLLLGRSGSGKTTLLHVLAGLLKPTEGAVRMGETELYSLEDRELSRLRNEKIGVIPQGRSMVDTLTVMENILLPGILYHRPVRVETAEQWMEALGIAKLREARPAELSGGELRRAAIARTLSGNPEVILADEPTGDLDGENTSLVLETLREQARRGAAVLLVTHENEAVKYADEKFHMEAGTLKKD